MPKSATTTEPAWDADQLHAQHLLAVSVGAEKKTMAQIAADVGVCENTLRKWRRMDGFQAAVNSIATKALAEFLPGVLEAMGRKACAEDVPAARLVLELLGLIEGKAVNVGVNVNNDNRTGQVLTPEQVFRRAVSKNGDGLARVLQRTGTRLPDGTEGETT